MSKSSVSKRIWMVVYILFAGLMGFILAVSILKPLQNLIPVQMAVFSAVSAAAFLALCFFWNKLYDGLKKKNRTKTVSVLYWILFGLFGCSVFVILLIHGNHYHIPGDYEFIYISALQQADARALDLEHYFLTYSNNIKPMLMLSVLFKACKLVHIDEYVPVLFISVLTLLGSTWAVGELVSDKENRKWRLPSLLFLMICLPVYVFTGVFYTDTMSFGMGVIAVALLKIAFQKDKKIYLIPLAAAIATIGAGWKITALIPVIAWILTALIFKKWRKWGKIALFSGCLAVFMILLSVWAGSYDISKEAKEKANPVTAWLALGMTGDGSYAQGVDFSDSVNDLPDKAAKSEFTKEYMKEHLPEAFSFSHIVAKTGRNYASGMFSASDFTARDEHGSVLYELMDPGGAYYWRVSQVMFCYMAVVYAVGIFGCIAAAVRLAKGKNIPPEKALADIAFFGLFVFLMIWESNNRQLYNMVPMMIAGTFLNIRLLFEIRKKEE